MAKIKINDINKKKKITKDEMKMLSGGASYLSIVKPIPATFSYKWKMQTSWGSLNTSVLPGYKT